MTCDKVGDDGHEVFLEFGGVALGVLRSHLCVKSHEAAPTHSQDGFDELESDPAQPVSMCDRNLLDASFDRALQKGDETPSMEVDAGRNIFNDFVAGGEQRRAILADA